MQFHEFANLYPLMQGTEFDDLCASILKSGLLHEITLFEDKIIDGRNRYNACIQAGVIPRYKQYNGLTTPDGLLEYVQNENEQRRHLTSGQLAAIAVSADELIQRLFNEAKARQGERNDLRNKEQNEIFEQSNIREIIPECCEEQRPREILAEKFNTNSRYVQDAMKIKVERPDLLEKIKEGEITIQQAKKEITSKQPREKLNDIPFPNDIFSVIYIDPPWPVSETQWEKWESRIIDKYPIMTIEEIKALPIKRLASENCSLFMWTTHRFLHEAFHLIEQWGFKYYCTITWDKGSGWTQDGFNKRTEFLLYAYSGKMSIKETGDAIPTIISEKKKEHSTKPEIIRELIEQKTMGNRLEMFARKQSDGWTVWGNEVETM